MDRCQQEGDVHKPDCESLLFWLQSENVCCRLPGMTPGASYGLDFPGEEESLSNLH